MADHYPTPGRVADPRGIRIATRLEIPVPVPTLERHLIPSRSPSGMVA